jgi:predicted nucleotidyltransferase
MERLVADRQSDIAALCRRFRVRRLEVFGSAATGAFDPARSDIDFLVEFEDLRQGEWADAYFGLLEGLAALFGRPVDLVTVGAVRNPYLLRSIEATRSPLYAA